MTAPSYTEDLTDIATGDESTGWAELTGTDGDGNSYNAMGGPAYQDNEYPYIQGSYAVTQDCTKSTAVGSLAYSSGGITVPTDGAVFVWQNFSSPFAMGSYAQGGYRICIGSGLSDFSVWFVGGSDKDNNPYGGWVNHVVNPTVTADKSAGTPTSTLDYVGSAVYVLSGPSKGEPHQCDVLRYGRGSAIFEHGDGTNGYCTIAGFAAQNDSQSNRWGLIQATAGGYLWKGRLQLGSASNAVDFRDSNKTIYIQWTPKVTANFNTIEVINASSNIEMTGFQFICLDPSGTASKGRWITTNDATVALTNCTFNDMATFGFDGNTAIDGCAFKRCGQVTQAGASIDDTAFSESTGTIALTAAIGDISSITNCRFTSGGSGHGLEITGTATDITLSNLDFVGYDTANPGTAANKAVYVNIASGSMTINISGGSGVSESYHVRTAGATVTISADTTVTFTGLKDNSEVRVYKVSDDSAVAGTEDATTGTPDNRSFSWAAPSGTEVYYRIHCFEPGDEIYETIFVPSYTVPSNDTSIPISQRLDRNAEN